MKKKLLYIFIIILFGALFIQSPKAYASGDDSDVPEIVEYPLYNNMYATKYSDYLTVPDNSVFLNQTLTLSLAQGENLLLFDMDNFKSDHNLNIDDINNMTLSFEIYPYYEICENCQYSITNDTETKFYNSGKIDLIVNVNQSKNLIKINYVDLNGKDYPLSSRFYNATLKVEFKEEFNNEIQISDINEINELSNCGGLFDFRYKGNDLYDLIFNDGHLNYVYQNTEIPYELDISKIQKATWEKIKFGYNTNKLVKIILDDETVIYWSLNDGKYEITTVVTITSDEIEYKNKWEVYVHFNTDLLMDDIYKMKVSYTDYYKFGGFGWFGADWIKGSEQSHEEIISSIKSYDTSHGFLDWYTSGMLGKKGTVKGISRSTKDDYKWAVYLGDMNEVEKWADRDKFIQEAVSSMIRPSSYHIKDYTVLKMWYSYQGVSYVSSQVVDAPLASNNTQELSDMQVMMLKASNATNNPFFRWVGDNITTIIIVLVIIILCVLYATTIAPIISIGSTLFRIIITIIKTILSIIFIPFNLLSSSSKKPNHYKKFR